MQVCRQMGHEVEARGSGREGMAVVGEVRPELLLVDLKIPDMNGLEVIQECRREYWVCECGDGGGGDEAWGV